MYRDLMVSRSHRPLGPHTSAAHALVTRIFPTQKQVKRSKTHAVRYPSCIERHWALCCRVCERDINEAYPHVGRSSVAATLRIRWIEVEMKVRVVSFKHLSDVRSVLVILMSKEGVVKRKRALYSQICHVGV